jgi:hypothetical protein
MPNNFSRLPFSNSVLSLGAAVLAKVLTGKDLLEMPIWLIAAAAAIVIVVIVIDIFRYRGFHLLPDRRDRDLKICDSFSSLDIEAIVFVYGTLLVRNSLQRTVSAEDCPPVCMPARLNSYRLDWGVPRERPDFVNRKGEPAAPDQQWLSLVIHQSGQPGDSVDGALLGVSRAGLIALQNREVNYTLSDVEGQVELLDPKHKLPRGDVPVVAFLPRGEQAEMVDSGQGFVIRKPMFRDISRALKRLGHGPLSLPRGAKLVDGFLVTELLDPVFQSPRGESAVRKIHESLGRSGLSATQAKRPSVLNPIGMSQAQYNLTGAVAQRSVKLAEYCVRIIHHYPDLLEFGGWHAVKLGQQDHASQPVGPKDLLDTAQRFGDLSSFVSRVDLVQSGNRLLVLEINTDSPAGMPHLDALTRFQKDLGNHDGRLKILNSKAANLTETILEELVNAARKRPGTENSPSAPSSRTIPAPSPPFPSWNFSCRP